MPYKDAEKRKKAKRDSARRKRQGSTHRGSTSEGSTFTPPPDDELFAGLPDALKLYADSEQGGLWYRQMIYHLKTTPIEQLQTEVAERIRPFIPCWRYKMEQPN